MLARLSTTAFVLFSVVLFLFFLLPHTARAVGSAADAMCNPVQQVCGCGQIPNPKGGCMGGANMFMCPCFDSTSGFTTTGKCVAANTCLAQGTSDNKGPDQGLSQLMSQLGQMLQQMMKGGGDSGGGSGSGSGGCASGIYQTGDKSNTDPCAYYVPGAGSSTSNLLNGFTDGSSGSSAANDLISSLIGSSNSNDNSNSNTNTNTSTTSSNTSGAITPGSTSVIANISNPQNLKPGTSATVSQTAFGNAPGITGDIQVLSGNRVTMLASNRDTTGNKQISGFYGFSTSIGESVATVYSQACAARQWASNFISFIIPVTYLDTLCSSHGYSVGPPKLLAPTPPPSPTPTASQASSTPQYLGAMRADIWASPSTVTSGARASVFWTSSGVLSCAVSGGGISASTLSGNASTLPLSQDTTFSISCQSATSSISNSVIVKVQ